MWPDGFCIIHLRLKCFIYCSQSVNPPVVCRHCNELHSRSEATFVSEAKGILLWRSGARASQELCAGCIIDTSRHEPCNRYSCNKNGEEGSFCKGLRLYWLMTNPIFVLELNTFCRTLTADCVTCETCE